MIAVEPKAELGEMFDAAGGARQAAGRPDADQLRHRQGRRRARAHELFRWFGLGWKVNAELPGPGSLRRRRRQFVRAGGRRRADPVRGRRRGLVEARQYVDAGFTDLALVQIGGDQQAPFIGWAEQRADAGAAPW